jgi:hypothetical protein
VSSISFILIDRARKKVLADLKSKNRTFTLFRGKTCFPENIINFTAGRNICKSVKKLCFFAKNSVKSVKTIKMKKMMKFGKRLTNKLKIN